jgi:prepilin-type N-terminal cleavage/methylation domain-containing protein/prepilin-type processing-associated H-X9-DG protein
MKRHGRFAVIQKERSVRAYERRAGFTLIELLVVIAIIALLIAFMLPAIARAKEQAKQVKCNANLKQIGTAMRFYFTETSEWFPFEKRNIVSGSPWAHGFYYGGHPGRQYSASEWWGYVQKPYRDTPKGRPFNQYIYSELPNWDVPKGDPLFESVRQMDAFKCTNDTGGFWMNTDGMDDAPITQALYWMVGSSYDLNYHFSFNWSIGKFSGENPVRWLQRSNAFLRRQQMYWATTLIMLYEDPFDSAQWMGISRRGWHRQMNRHNFLFLDGHAANTYTDTKKVDGRRPKRGLGWKSASGFRASDPEAWWNDKDDPDYQYRNIDPLAGGQPR